MTEGGPRKREAPEEIGPGPGTLLAATGAFGLSAWLAGRGAGGLWSGELLLLVAVAFGALAHAAARRYRPGQGLLAWLEGAAGHYLLFVGAGVFLAVEAYAVGLASGSEAPGLALLAMLLPPVAVAGYALRRAEEGSSGASDAEIDGSGT
jgi:hypothetical protein